MALTTEEVQHIALLARLQLDDDAIETYREQLSAILEYAERLQELDTKNVAPMAGLRPEHTTLRPDEPRAGLGAKKLLENAPDHSADQFKVPPILD
jgi:aspartyl-tRNA(Asn)/glutamyl-tRNA(Gln) amidotransferase subunit C